MTQPTISTCKLPDSVRGAFMKQLMNLIVISIVTITGLAGCSNGVSNREAPPEAHSATVQAEDLEATYFRDTIYTNIFRAQQCKNCHVTGGSGAANGMFADENISTAYADARDKFNPANVPFDINSPVSDTNPATADLTNNSFYIKVHDKLHNCWGSGCDSSGQEIVDQLRAWVVALNKGGSVADNTDPAPVPKDILKDPQPNQPVVPVLFDGDVNKFQALYDLVTKDDQGNPGNCARCHSSTTTGTPQRPFFADSSIDTAYQYVVSAGVVNLAQPGKSKLVVRPYPGLHNCGSTCSTLSQQIEAAIGNWASAIHADNPNATFNENGDLVPSMALTLNEGQVTSGGVRYDDYVVAKYLFDEGSKDSKATVAYDSSGVSPTVNLQLLGDVKWVGGFGLEIGPGGQARSTSVDESQKLHDLLVARGEYSIEAWVIPDNTAQQGTDMDSSVIASYSAGSTNRNFTLGQYKGQYAFHNRVGSGNSGGTVLLSDDNQVETSLQHIVMTYTEADGRKIYINGKPVLCETDVTISGDFPKPCDKVDDSMKETGPLTAWNTNYLLTLGSDTNGSNQWLGKIKFLAIHRKALTEREVNINFDAGVGQKFNLLFNISVLKKNDQWDSSMKMGDRSYIWFEVAQYDDYSYLFSEPKYIDLDYNQANPPETDFTLRGIRIGINGKEASVGQAFSKLGKSNDYTAYNQNSSVPNSALQIKNPDPVSLSRLQGEQFGSTTATGTVIPIDSGVDTDQFFLTFEMLGGVTENAQTRPVEINTLSSTFTGTGPSFVVGTRTFDEINEAMSAVTGISTAAVYNDDPNNSALKGFETLKSQLPDSETISGFLPSHQTAIASLAGRYCDKRVEATGSSVITDGLSAEQYFGVDQVSGFSFATSLASEVFFAGTTDPNGNVAKIADAIIGHMVRNVGTLVDPTGAQPPDAINNGIKPEVMSLASYLLGEKTTQDSSTGLPTPHVCDTDIPDCTSNSRMKTIVKAMCTAVLASAIVTQQ